MSIVSDAKNSPVCPNCGAKMVRRNSSRGAFWGCADFPACRGTRPITVNIAEAQTTRYEPLVKMAGSPEQEAIWEAMVNGKKNLLIKAGPGTGKTWTMIQGCLRIPKKKKVRGMAFNKHIADEVTAKLAASGCTNVQFTTVHSYGNSILRKNFKTIAQEINTSKMDDILEMLSPKPFGARKEELSQWRKTLNLAKRLCSITKNHLLDFNVKSYRSQIEKLIDHYGVEYWSPSQNISFTRSTAYSGDEKHPGNLDEALGFLKPALQEDISRAKSSIDYDDMPWLPIVMNLDFEECDELIADEVQDFNALQHEFTLRAGAAGKISVVGDPHQAIYGFRGAAIGSMDVMEEALRKTKRKVKIFPLTITRRCPVLHVQMATYLYPDLKAADDAPLGEIRVSPNEATAVAEMRIGDLVICRVNAPLISVAYKLIRRRVRPVVKGRKIGEGLIELMDNLCERITVSGAIPDMPALRTALHEFRMEQEAKLMSLGDKAASRLEALHEKCSCFEEFMSNSTSISEMRTTIDTLFNDKENPNNVVTLGTVHRTKGLEAYRIFILAPELIPHPAANKAWEVEQEKNLAWVAATRAKYDNSKNEPGTIVFIGQVSRIYTPPTSLPSSIVDTMFETSQVEPDVAAYADQHVLNTEE